LKALLGVGNLSDAPVALIVFGHVPIVGIENGLRRYAVGISGATVSAYHDIVAIEYGCTNESFERLVKE
jgi:hypothetical protein